MKTSMRITALAMVAAFAAVTCIAATASGAGQGGGNRPAPRAPQFVAPAAKYLAMKPATLLKQLKAKKTLASIAEAKSKSTDGLKAAIIADAEAKLAKDVAADRIDQDEADERLTDLQSRIDDIVTKPMPARGSGGAGAPGGGNCPNRPGGGADTGAGAPSTDTGGAATPTTPTATTGGAYL